MTRLFYVGGKAMTVQGEGEDPQPFEFHEVEADDEQEAFDLTKERFADMEEPIVEGSLYVQDVKEVPDFSDFQEKYTLMINHLDENAACDGTMFETFGEELAYVMAQDPDTVWTLTQGDGDASWVTHGYHLVNRLGYFVTKQIKHPDDDGGYYYG
jgi:hypothetical protein